MKQTIILTESQINSLIKNVKHIITEGDNKFELDEKRSHPDTNVDQSFNEFFHNLTSKYDSKDIFVSFRDTQNVTDINPKNQFNTPTGFYCYPLSSYDYDESMSEYEFRGLFPYASDRKYMQFIILKTHDGLLYRETSKATLDEYVQKIKILYENINPVVGLCDNFLNNKFFSTYIPKNNIKHDTHLFWLFLYEIAPYIMRKRKETAISLICTKVGINGFIDYNGDWYIHPSEPKQAVFFKVKNIANIYTFKSPKVNSEYFKKNIDKMKLNFIDGFAIVSQTYEPNHDKYNFVDKSGNFISKQWFDHVNDFNDGLAKVILNNKNNWIDKSGNFISKQWFSASYNFNDGLAVVVQIDDSNNPKYNFVDKSGNLLSKQWFSFAYDFNDGLAKVAQIDDSNNTIYNFIDKSGNLLSKQWFDSIFIFYNGFYLVELNNKWNFIDKSGNLLSKQWFDLVDNFKNGLAMVKLNNKWNLIDKSGNLLSKQWFDRVAFLINGFYKCTLNNLDYYIDNSGNLYDVDQNLIKKSDSIQENKLKKIIILTESQFKRLIENNQPVEEFNGVRGYTLSKETQNNLYEQFKDAYDKSVGQSWTRDKFISRLQNWTLYGNSDGFVTVREQPGGLIKLTGSAGNAKGILNGLEKLNSTDRPIWGFVTRNIGNMLIKKGFIAPNSILLKPLFSYLKTKINIGDNELTDNGSLIHTTDLGTKIEKIFVANREYFEFLLKNPDLYNDPKIKMLSPIIKKVIKSQL